VGSKGYDVARLRADLARFVVLLGGADVDRLFFEGLARVSKDLEAAGWFPQAQRFSVLSLVYYPRQRLGAYRSRSKIL
jgi:hypothetical protein